MKDLTQLQLKLQSLAIFRGLLDTTALGQFYSLLGSIPASGDTIGAVRRYAEFVRELYLRSGNWTEYLLNAVLEEENLYVLQFAKTGCADMEIEECLTNELLILEEAASVTSAEVRRVIGYKGFLPDWNNSVVSFVSAYRSRMTEIASKGYGIYAKYHTFIVKDGDIVPVKNPDDTALSDLNGYEAERREVIDNTIALLSGKPAANILLYGDAGTGKSSTVKAVANEFQSQGLRLIELKKRDLHSIPDLIDRLSQNPLKFILFIDDLSFTRDDDDFSALKAVLEGSVSAKTSNLAIYATSNRRHLVKESFSDRDGDDIHRGDTMQELVSLSERFGLTITFCRPNRKEYLAIVLSLARHYQINLPEESIAARADAYAIRRSGYSPRVAKQFVESLKAAGE